MNVEAGTLPPERKAELKAAGLKVLAATAVAGGLFALYAHEVKVEAEVQDLLSGVKIATGRAGGARSDLNRDTVRGWLSAEEALNRALDLQPSNPWAVAAMADVEVMLSSAGVDGRGPRAEEALARADAKDLNLPERFEAHGLHLIAAGQAAEAETWSLSLLDRYGSLPRVVDVLGRAQRATGKLSEAKANFKRAQDADWRSPRFVADYGQALLEDGNPGEAAAAFDRALQANSDHSRGQIGKARALVALSLLGRGGTDLKAARALCDAVLAKKPEEVPGPLKAQALAARSTVSLAEGALPAAASDAEAAVRADPKSSQALRAKALASAASKSPEAVALFKAAIDADRYDASLYFEGAAALAAAGDGAGAEKILGACAATLPRSARYHLSLAQLLARRDDNAAAKAELAKAEALEPTNAQVYFEEGRLAQKQRDNKGAVAAYERAVKLRDDYPEVYRQMGALYLEGKDVDGALKVFNEALARYKSARAPAPVMESFYSDVVDQVSRAGKKKLAQEWVRKARALH